MDLDELLTICRAFHDLGWSVSGQLEDMGSGDNNPNAVDMIESRFLPLLPDDLAEELRYRIAVERQRASNKDVA